MKYFCLAGCLFILLFSVASTKAIGPVECSLFILSEDDLDSRYTITTDVYFDSVHSVMFYDNPDLDGILTPPKMKYFQTINQNKSVEGTVFYYQYDSENDAQKATNFLKGFFRGENGCPSASHPEEIYVINNMLLVLSFDYNSRESRTLRDAIMKKTNVDIYCGKDVQDFTEIKFQITELDTLQLPVSKLWKVEANFIDERTVEITPADGGNSFIVLITAELIIPNPQYEYSASFLYTLTRVYGEPLLDMAVEKELIVHEIISSNNVGYYYTLTDKNPKPNEWRYLTQGFLRTGDLILEFTILTDDEFSTDKSEALTMLGYAKHFADK